MSSSDPRRAVETVWRIEAPRLIAGLARMVRDVGVAEELAQDALVSALEHWPREGVPDNPGAWLMTTAKRRAVDRLRHERLAGEKLSWLGDTDELAPMAEPDPSQVADDHVGDDLLRLIFTACHPVLSREAQTALTLRLLGGLSTDEIARAFLVPEATIAQRIVRAKKTLSQAKVAFELPDPAQRDERIDAVLGVIYLIYNEGYAATAGEDWMRPALCQEALRLGRVLAGLAPRESEVHGLLALMELQSSRAPARTASDGTPILLLDQDRSRWDRLLIRRGLAQLELAARLGGADGPCALQAAIAACHARAVRADDTDWSAIAALYARLAQVAPSPVVELNRAVAVGMAAGPEAGLALADALREEPRLQQYHLLPAVRADLLHKLGRLGEACDEFTRAAELTRNERERRVLLGRAQACRGA